MMPRRNKQSETELQILSAQWLALKLPRGFLAIHPANEGRRSWVEGKRQKAMGLTAGVSDWIIMGRSAHSASFYATAEKPSVWCVELKSAKGRISPAQKAHHTNLNACGVPIAVCRSLEEIEAALKAWGILT